LADALKGVQVDQDVGQRVGVGNRLTVAQLGSLDAEIDGLTVDAFGGGALLENGLIGFTVPVELIA
jgi:hypothetical protein